MGLADTISLHLLFSPLPRASLEGSPGPWVPSTGSGAPKSGAPKGGSPKPRKKEAPKGGGPEGWRARNFALFFPLPPQNSFSLPSLGCLLVEFWWCLKRRALKCARLEFFGLSCETPAARTMLIVPPLSLSPCLFFFAFFHLDSCVFFLNNIVLCGWAKRLKHQFGPKSAWPNSAIQILAKSRSVKVGQSRSKLFGQSRIGQSRPIKDGHRRFGQSRPQRCSQRLVVEC